MTHVEKNKLLEGSLWKGIFFFSLPLIFSNLLQVLFNLSDIAVIGKFSGPIALGSVGSTAIVVTLFTGFLIGLGSGINVLVARYFGASDDEGVKQTIHTAFVVCLCMGVLIFLCGFFLSKYLLILLKTKEELLPGAILYLQIYFIGMPAMAIYNFGHGIYSAIGNTKKPLLFLSIAGFINISLNLLFVIVCKMDVAGVALASVISQYFSAFLILFSLIKNNQVYALKIKEIKVSAHCLKKILFLGIPAGLQMAIFSIANLFIQSAVNSFDTVMVEGNAAAQNADALVYDVMAAFYTACSSYMSQNFGAGKKKRVLKSYFISLLYSFLIGAIIGGGLVLLGEPFLKIFTSDEQVVQAGMKRLVIMGASYAVSAFMDNTIAASRGLGKSIIPTIMVILGSCVFRVIWVYTIFSYYHTFTSLYLVYVTSWAITSLFEIAYFVYCYRKQMKLHVENQVLVE